MKDNIFSNTPSLITGEIFSELLKCRNVVIQKIVSSDKPDHIIYNQPQDEWVILLQGKATLQLENNIINLTSGDYLFIPANTCHQVTKTSTNPYCIWLAVHINPED
ncbi:hypothetical protein GM3708_1085 [Geminocystis sp. NIES-3708]|uniref:cupin domain-containing protein n=1 Tax=Geminocystis sp. NIES-3708 TaxID=1615909 RepID=UPI0005FC66DB|nr:cupin domain-containing protein [Geminocystis sp. NIES-3708]BAQ60679.1 hypothetical protein GM3708_1085 [Geminocystis sp. NIES-3708]